MLPFLQNPSKRGRKEPRFEARRGAGALHPDWGGGTFPLRPRRQPPYSDRRFNFKASMHIEP
jgi:hypothetical protein